MTSDLSTEVASSDIDRLSKPWWTCWAALEWGFRRNAVCYWCCHGQISGLEAREVLGVNITYPLDLIIFYRELVVTMVPEHDLALEIVRMTPIPERAHLSRFYAGRSVFEQGHGSMRPIHRLIDEVTVPAHMPRLRRLGSSLLSVLTRSATALDVDDCQCGFTVLASSVARRMIFDGLRRTHSVRSDDPPKRPGETPLLLVSSECPELISALPSLESDPKNLEDVRQIGTVQDDVWSAACNAYRDYPSVVAGKPIEVLRAEAVNRSSDPTQRQLNFLKFNDEHENQSRPRKR